jgi:hypothetical protein
MRCLLRPAGAVLPHAIIFTFARLDLQFNLVSLQLAIAQCDFVHPLEITQCVFVERSSIQRMHSSTPPPNLETNASNS